MRASPVRFPLHGPSGTAPPWPAAVPQPSTPRHRFTAPGLSLYPYLAGSWRLAMATGWAGDGAVQDQIDATVSDAIKRARARLRQGPGLEHCEECDAEIPQAGRVGVPGVRLGGHSLDAANLH